MTNYGVTDSGVRLSTLTKVGENLANRASNEDKIFGSNRFTKREKLESGPQTRGAPAVGGDLNRAIAFRSRRRWLQKPLLRGAYKPIERGDNKAAATRSG